MKEYMVIFFTHSGAIKFQRKLNKSSIECQLMPVPRSLSSNCGIGAKISYESNILSLIDTEVEKIFELSNGEYTNVFSQD